MILNDSEESDVQFELFKRIPEKYAEHLQHFFRAMRLKNNQEKTKRKIRENNEHLVPRPFTSNNEDQNDKTPKLEDELTTKIER